MKIIEMLSKTSSWITGYHTRLIVEDEGKNRVAFCVLRQDENGEPIGKESCYYGSNEDEAVRIFLEEDEQEPLKSDI